MRYGIAMYRGGMVVDAQDCDHQTTRDLGVICPYCSEALFWRSGSEFLRNKGTPKEVKVIVPSALCHYSTSDTGEACELRSQTSQGKQDIDRLAAQSRQQRLDLYNKHLWSMFSADRNMNRQAMQSIRKAYGDKWIEDMAKKVQAAFGKRTGDWRVIVERYVQNLSSASDQDFRNEVAQYGQLAPDYMIDDAIAQAQYFSRVDAKIHIEICSEIIGFLGTRTAKYAFKQIFTCWLQQSSIAIATYLQQQYPPQQIDLMRANGQFGKLMINQTKQVTPDSFCEGMAMTVAGTHWIEQIQSRIGKER